MKNVVLSIIFLFAVTYAFSTEQISDKLIVDGDTIYLKSFPLEELKIEKSPFTYGEYNFPHTGCWRGYCATWKIIDRKLALIEVVKVDSTKENLDIINYLKLNNYQPKLVNGYVYADWYTKDLKTYSAPFQFEYEEFYLDEEFTWTEDKRETKLKFDKGVLTEMNIHKIDYYHIGDTLNLRLSIFPPGLVKSNYLKIEGKITENNGRMVKVKIFSYGSKRKKKIKKIKQFLKCKLDSDEMWINPRYCK